MIKKQISKSNLVILGSVLFLGFSLSVLSANISKTQYNAAEAARRQYDAIPPITISNGENNYLPVIAKSGSRYHSVWSQDDNIAFASSRDGKKWTAPKILQPVSNRQQLEPQLEICRQYIYVTYRETNNAYLIYSRNQGLTWSNPIKVGGDENPIVGNAYIATDKKCNLFAFGSKEYLGKYYLYKTSDKGKTWNDPMDTGLTVKATTEFIIEDNVMHIAWPSGSTVKYARSNDYGNTWQEETLSFKNRLYGYETRSMKVINGLPMITVQDKLNGGDVYLASKAADGSWSDFELIGIPDMNTTTYDFDVNTRKWYVAQANWEGNLVVSVSKDKGKKWLPSQRYDANYHSLDLYVTEQEISLEFIQDSQIKFTRNPETRKKWK